MKKKITKNTIMRGLRTFFQAFFGAFITAGAGIIWTDIDIKNALIGILLTSLFAGFSAIGMNLETKEIYLAKQINSLEQAQKLYEEVEED